LVASQKTRDGGDPLKALDKSEKGPETEVFQWVFGYLGGTFVEQTTPLARSKIDTDF
jgi:hypothetical protein